MDVLLDLNGNIIHTGAFHYAISGTRISVYSDIKTIDKIFIHTNGWSIQDIDMSGIDFIGFKYRFVNGQIVDNEDYVNSEILGD